MTKNLRVLVTSTFILDLLIVITPLIALTLPTALVFFDLRSKNGVSM